MARLHAVVLNHRTPQLTSAAVASLEASDRRPDAVWVVDNGSGPGEAQALRAACPRATVLALERNLGFSGGCNAGLRGALAAGADLLLLLNSDAEVSPACLGALEGALAARPDLGIVAPSILERGGARVESLGISYSPWTGRMRNLGSGGRPPGPAQGGVAAVDGVPGAAMLARRAVLERVGLFEDAFFFSYEDLDLCLRARAAGFGTACVRGATATHAGAHTIGQGSPRRLYYATRNHLLLARRARPLPAVPALLRGGAILAVNLAQALLTAKAPRRQGLRAVAQGARDHLLGRYGEGPRD